MDLHSLMGEMETTGSCLCGAIEYRAEIAGDRIGLCHCRDCQIVSGSAFRTAAVVAPEKFAVTKGQPRFFDKAADSGRVRRLLFCGDCGTHICSMPPDPSAPGSFVSVRATTSKDIHRLVPAVEIWCGSRLPWMPEIAGTAKYDGNP